MAGKIITETSTMGLTGLIVAGLLYGCANSSSQQGFTPVADDVTPSAYTTTLGTIEHNSIDSLGNASSPSDFLDLVSRLNTADKSILRPLNTGSFEGTEYNMFIVSLIEGVKGLEEASQTKVLTYAEKYANALSGREKPEKRDFYFDILEQVYKNVEATIDMALFKEDTAYLTTAEHYLKLADNLAKNKGIPVEGLAFELATKLTGLLFKYNGENSKFQRETTKLITTITDSILYARQRESTPDTFKLDLQYR